MDPRNTPRDPFGRPTSESATRDPRNAPIPPPPYTLQAPLRQPQPTFANDPFLPRRNEQDGSRQEPPRPISQSPFSLEKYAAALSRESTKPAMISGEGKPRDTNGAWSYGDRMMNGYRSHDTAGMGSASASSLPPPPPPPPPSSFASSAYDSPTSREIPRQRDHRPSSPRMYNAQDHPPPPPPPPFASRPMLPPSPQYNPPASMTRAPPPPPPFPGGRDLPAPSSAARPGSSMSISSMLDSTPAGRPPRETGSATILNGASPTGSYSSLTQQHQQPPPTPSPTNSSNGNGFLRRHSPEKQSTPQASTTRIFRAYSGGGNNRSYSSTKAGSPDSSTFGPPSVTSVPQYSPRSESGGQPEWKFQNKKNPTIGNDINRPSSQPNSFSNPQIDMERRTAGMDVRSNVKHEDASREASSRQANRVGVASFDFLGRQAQLDRQRELENVEFGRQKRLEQEQRSATQSGPREERLSGMNYPFLTQSSVFSEPAIAAARPEKESVITRLLEHSYQPQRNSTMHKGPLSEESLRRLREERQKQSQPTTKYSPTASRFLVLGNADDRQAQGYPYNITTGSLNPDGRVGTDVSHQQLRPPDDISQNHRNMLALINDNNKRAGRVSPLPQAVQGAQGQKRGPSSDPSIKNEFSRMFAGIGSGVGSAGLNSGASTPFPPPSPKPNAEADKRTSLPGHNDPSEARARNGSRIGKRAKKVRDEIAKEKEKERERDKDKEVVVIDDAGTGSKGVKRQKHNHHHHFNHRHHHHHRQDEHNGTPSHNTNDSTTPIPRNHLHHHHRADGTIHYHPSSSKPATTTRHKPPRLPSTTIRNDNTLDLIRNLPRRHLGSILYNPPLEPPTTPAASDSKFSYATAPFVIPRCEGKENCTLTVRIPRFYLSKTEREQVCARRAVWGTDIYTDDSDPLAAAIHAGWVRGEWGDDVDISMLEINPITPATAPATDAAEPESNHKPQAQTVFTTPPPMPINPPPGKDLHLTLLILPSLQSYAARVGHGIMSRAWGRDHDGLSFRIEKMRWVDGGVGKGEERGAEAKKRRLVAGMGMGRGGVVAAPVRLGIGIGKGAERRKAVAVA